MLAEIARRRARQEHEVAALSSIFLTLTELDRIDAFRRVEDTYGLSESPATTKLLQCLLSGPPLGVHTVLSFSGLAAYESVLDRQALRRFRHRVALQMAEEASFTFIGSRKAAQLQSGDSAICALYLNVESDNIMRFKPYNTDSFALAPAETLTGQIATIGHTLAQRGQRV